MADLTLDETKEVVLVDGAGVNEALVTSTGNLRTGKYDSVGNEQISRPTALSNKVYIGSVTGTLAASGTDAPMMLIRNPSGSGKKMRIQNIIATLSSNAALGAQDISVRFRVAPTVTTTGSAGTVVNGHLGGGAAATAMQVFSQPTLSAFGTLIKPAWAVSGASAGIIATLDMPDQIVLEAGQDMCITGLPDGTNRGFAAAAWWIEE